jgi:cell fate (sporulation/competence/biofilm development) regulator YlbF (YheA/YmcA/DUF963 family)
MDDPGDLAKRLGAAISADARTKALREATAAVQADPAARLLQEEYATAIEELHELEEHGRPIEPDRKRKVAALADSVRRSPTLQRLLKAHAEFAEMMDGVQHAIGAAVESALGGDGGGGSEPEEPRLLVTP